MGASFLYVFVLLVLKVPSLSIFISLQCESSDTIPEPKFDALLLSPSLAFKNVKGCKNETKLILKQLLIIRYH